MLEMMKVTWSLRLVEFEKEQQQSLETLENGFELIRRFDEVICEKAQKHALVEL